MVERDENGRTAWGPRVLAPLAFFAAVTVLALLVQSALNTDTGKSEATPPPSTSSPNATVPTGTGKVTAPKSSCKKRYTIRNGDTLEAIAERCDTTVDDLIALNPGIEANALKPGAKLNTQ